MDGISLGHVSEFWANPAECCMKVASGRRVAGAISSLVNTKSLQLECARIMHESLFMTVLMYGNETTIWKKKERSRIRAV